jgi:hypothetical protein
MSLVLLVTAFLGFNSMTGTEPIQTVISAPVIAEPEAVVEAAPVIEAAPIKKVTTSVNAADAAAELEFLNAQLSTAAVMLETLQLIEGKE